MGAFMERDAFSELALLLVRARYLLLMLGDDGGGAATERGFRYTRSSFKCNSSKAVETFKSDSA